MLTIAGAEGDPLPKANDRLTIAYVSGVGIFNCTGQRDETLNRQLLSRSGQDWRLPRTLRFDDHIFTDSCWLHGSTCCIAR